MAANFLRSLGSRKRKLSTASSDGTSSGGPLNEDPEITFNFYPPSSKKRKPFRIDPDLEFNEPFYECGDDEVTFNNRITNASTSVCQLVDEDISFRIFEPTADVELEPRRSPNGYILPDPLPEGLVLTDLRKDRWRIGRSVGLGGFGEIYSASSWNSANSADENYVVKVEPHTNGPLFTEINFYLRVARPEQIETYKSEKDLEQLGVPHFVASGSFFYRGKKLRFLVLPRYGTDLQTLIDASGNVLEMSTTCSISVQVINCFEYLHSNGYVHKDLKGSNLLFSRQGPADGKIYLVDYGLVSKLSRSGLPRPNIPDLRSAHEGTLEFCSRDAHRGCISKRGDFEVLLYNVIDWLGGKLPWDKEPQLKPSIIEAMKNEAFDNVKSFLDEAFQNTAYPAFLEKLMLSIRNMKFHDDPDYDMFRSIFIPNCDSPKLMPLSDDDEVVFNLKMVTPTTKKSPATSNKKNRKKNFRAKPRASKKKGLRNGGEIQIPDSDPVSEQLASSEEFDQAMNNLIKARDLESLKNPTPAMQEQLSKMNYRQMASKLNPPLASGRRKLVGKRRRRRTGSGTNRQRRKSTDNDSTKSEPVTDLKDQMRSPQRPLATIRTVSIQRSNDARISLRKQFENVVGGFTVSQFLSKVSNTFFPFNK